MLQSPHRHTKKEIGMLMIILAAETVADCCITKEAALSTELIAIGKVTAPLKTMSLDSAFEASSGGESDTGMSTPTTDSAGEFVPPEHLMASLGTNAAIVGLVLSFLPWRKAIGVRSVSRLWFKQSLASAAILRMPASGLPAVFIPCDRSLDSVESVVEQELAPVPSRDHTNGMQRVFLGQLRRDATVPMVKWLFDAVFCVPDALVAVENHRNRLTYRGKGCAWAYVKDEASPNVLAFHRRVFYDSVRGVEGCWVVPSSKTAALASEIQVTGFAVQRPRHLPRNGLVCEVPLVNMKAHAEQSIGRFESYPNSPPPPPPPVPQSAVLETHGWGAVPPPPAYSEAIMTIGRTYRHNPYASQ